MPIPASYLWRWTGASPRAELPADTDLIRFIALAVGAFAYLIVLGG